MKRALIFAVVVGVPLAAAIYLLLATEENVTPALITAAPDEGNDDLTEPPPSSLPFGQAVSPLVSRFCVDCHGRGQGSGGIVLEGMGAEPSNGDLLIWRKAAQAMRSGRMPPAGEPRPSRDDREAFNTWLGAAAYRLDSSASVEPAHTPPRRLNRAEYNNTVRDLTGLDIRPADDFPADDVAYGFDNIGDVLAISPLLSERYIEAAEKIVERLFSSPEARERLLNPPSHDLLPYGLRGLLPVRDAASKAVHRADLPPDPAQQELERASNILRTFADRAYRRPITYDELNRLVRFVEISQQAGEGSEAGLKLALQAVLASPHFLFHGVGSVAPSSGATPLDHDFELASRLSYFLWSSMPDETLYRLAAHGKLREPRTLSAEARRMLQDPKAQALVDNFFAQWLQLRNLDEFTPDPMRFPDFDESLRRAMRRETELFCRHVLREDRSIVDFLDADYSFVNARLARHYGMAGIEGDDFQRVSLAGTNRGGLLAQASILAVTSNPTRTSPVKRGRWLLENVLAAPIPSPPPGADGFAQAGPGGGTLRQRLERHRSDAQCASCHEIMDPLGFALENFDAVGAWRTHDGGQPIDATGTLAGEAFAGPAELRRLLRSRREEFACCLSEKMLIYALGRGTVPSDQCAIDAIVRRLGRHDGRFSSLVVGIVLSRPFRMGPTLGR